MKTAPTFPAFPTGTTSGVNIRQLAAMFAMQGILANHNSHCHEHNDVADRAVKNGDALIAALAAEEANG